MAQARKSIRPKEKVASSTGKTKVDVFRFMDLPPELRELVYYHALAPIKPIDTAAISNTPDRVFFQPIAQLSKQTRNEALHVLFRSRPVEISLHSGENIRRALLWAWKWKDHARGLPQLIFSGKIAMHGNNFFTITLDISDEAPFYQAKAKKGATPATSEFIAKLKGGMLDWMESELYDVKEGRQGKLSGRALSQLISLVADASKSDDFSAPLLRAPRSK